MEYVRVCFARCNKLNVTTYFTQIRLRLVR